MFHLCSFFHSPFGLRNYSTDSHQIFRDCVLSDIVSRQLVNRHDQNINMKCPCEFSN